MLRIFLISCFLMLSLVSQGQTNISLLFPENEGTHNLEMGLPVFIWQPITSGTSLTTYRIKVVEVFQDQSPAIAILANPALYTSTVSGINTISYPIDAPALYLGGRYAWQLSVENDINLPEGEYPLNYDSEPWTFSIIADTLFNPTLSPCSPSGDTVFVQNGDDFWIESSLEHNEDLVLSKFEYSYYDPSFNLPSKMITAVRVGNAYKINYKPEIDRAKLFTKKTYILKGYGAQTGKPYVKAFIILPTE